MLFHADCGWCGPRHAFQSQLLPSKPERPLIICPASFRLRPLRMGCQGLPWAVVVAAGFGDPRYGIGARHSSSKNGGVKPPLLTILLQGSSGSGPKAELYSALLALSAR